jgi:hypothetical protein
LWHHKRNRLAHARSTPRRGRDQPHFVAVVSLVPAERTVRRSSCGCRGQASRMKCGSSTRGGCLASDRRTRAAKRRLAINESYRLAPHQLWQLGDIRRDPPRASSRASSSPPRLSGNIPESIPRALVQARSPVQSKSNVEANDQTRVMALGPTHNILRENSSRRSFAQQVRQLRHIRRNPSRLIFAEKLGCRSGGTLANLQ